jgi:hypothetical protein
MPFLFVLPTLVILLITFNCGLYDDNKENAFEKSIIVLSETKNALTDCLLRLFVNDTTFDYVTDSEGQINVRRADLGSSNEVDAFLVANGYICKRTRLNVTTNTLDTFFLKKINMTISDTASIFLPSVPPLAFILKDSLCLGKTNISELYLNPGNHSLVFVKSNCYDTLYTINLLSGKNPSIMVRIRKK